VNFTGFWGFVVVKSSFSQMVSLIVLLKNKGYPLKIPSKDSINEDYRIAQ